MPSSLEILRIARNFIPTHPGRNSRLKFVVESQFIAGWNIMHSEHTKMNIPAVELLPDVAVLPFFLSLPVVDELHLRPEVRPVADRLSSQVEQKGVSLFVVCEPK